MGTIRMVMLDGLAVTDLLALRQGGFFEGAEVRLPAGSPLTIASASPPDADAPRLAKVTLTETRPLTVGLPPPAAEVTGKVAVPAGVLTLAPAVRLTQEQEATLAQARAELADYRPEKAPPAAQDAQAEVAAGIDAPLAPVAAPAALTAGGLPSTAQLAACTKLRDVLQLLLEGGMPAEELTAYLESVRAEVPLLGRITNIGERVARTLGVMGQGG